MSDLQDLIDQWDTGVAAKSYPETSIVPFVEAARKWANPDYEAAAVVLWDATFPRGVHWRKLSPETREQYLALAAEAFDVALGDTEDK